MSFRVLGVLVLLSSSVASAAAPAPGSGVPLTRGQRALIAAANRAPGRPARTPIAVNAQGGVDEARLPAGIQTTLGTLRQVRGYLADHGGHGFPDARIARFSQVKAVKRAGVTVGYEAELVTHNLSFPLTQTVTLDPTGRLEGPVFGDVFAKSGWDYPTKASLDQARAHFKPLGIE